MNLKPQIYSQTNATQIKDGLAMIKKHLVGKEESVELAVDVGCGTGEVTMLLASHLNKSAQILAFDCDPEMVQFSKSSQAQKKLEAVESSSCKVDYFQDDISLQWGDLSERLRQVEGQVNLVFANYSFYWIPPAGRAIAVANILRLLKPGGKSQFILNVPLISSLDNCVESAAENERIGSFIKVPSFENQEIFWKQYFQTEINPNIRTLQGHVSSKDWTDVTTSPERASIVRQAFQTYLNDHLISYHKCFTRDMSSEDKTNFLNEIYDSIFATYFVQVQEGDGVTRSKLKVTVLEIFGCKK